ncbi:hypothetical protein BP6252_10404 [Coleophoma cylindrospora]|uniref:Zn(2)-C6 fungal-type domain-containing protein n=1 Tax=Coleophoma cylindrospora TaxID=1849047 RepID=A0A3D8QSF1_9HELO|nr:hypothetical protein BP6252_10404 [Coleophoma cylindrospora]
MGPNVGASVPVSLQRKKKCDGQKITCRNCLRLGKACHWRPVIQRARLANTTSIKPGAQEVSIIDQPPQPKISQRSQIEHQRQAASPSPQDRLEHVEWKPCPNPRGWLPAQPTKWSNTSWGIFQYYVNEYLPQLFRVSADNVHAQAVEAQLLQRAFRNPYMMETLLAQAALHLAGRDASYRVLALDYQLRAVSELRHYLAASYGPVDETNVCLAALGLCIFESHFQPAHISPSVLFHLDGVAKLIRRRVRNSPGYYDRSKSDADIALQRLVLESFLFHASRIPLLQGNGDPLPPDLDAAIAIAARICEAEAGSRGHPSPVLGMPPQVFILVYKLSCLARPAPRAQDDNSLQSDLDLAERLLAQLDAAGASTGQRASNAPFAERQMRATGEELAEDAERKGVEMMTLACKCLLASLQKKDDGVADGRERKLAVARAVASIDLSRWPSSYVQEFYRWPMQVLRDFLGGVPVWTRGGMVISSDSCVLLPSISTLRESGKPCNV